MGLLNRLFGERDAENAPTDAHGGPAGNESTSAHEREFDIDERLRQGLARHQAGDLQSAERAYRVVLDAAPEHAFAHVLLGSLLGASGRFDEALEHLQTASELDPSDAAPRVDLGNVLRALGRTQDAEDAYRDAISIDCEFPGGHRNLGDLLRHEGRLDEAIESLAKTASLTPDDADTHFLLADVLSQRGRYEEACRSYQAGLSIAPQVAAAHNNLGATLRHLSRAEEALASFEAALRLEPDYAEAHFNIADMMKSEGSADKAIQHYRAAASQSSHRVLCLRNLGELLLAEGRNEEALQCCQEVLTLEPASASSYFELGNALMACGHIGEASERFARAAELDPADARAHVNLGLALRSSGRFEEAARCFREALKIDPERVEAHNNLGVVLQMQGELQPAIDAFKHALTFAPSELYVQSNYLGCLNYQDGAVPEEVFEQHRRWAELAQSAAVAQQITAIRQPDRERRLRIGYVSADFRYHSVAFFITAIIGQHDRENFEVTCYSNVSVPDARTERIKDLSDHWRDISSLNDAEVAALIRYDDIDILVDLSGHTVGNRLAVFARRPAPVQVTYLGYPNTTGLDAMDYRLTDEITDPPGWGEHLHSEELIRFDGGFLCFEPLETCPDIRDTEEGNRSGDVVFGSFNELLKVTSPTVVAWCNILERIPGSQLAIKSTTLEDEGTRHRVLERFTERGIDPARVRLIGRTSTLEEHLDLYNSIDVALDTFPYNGTTTTCEALWMGVPVVTQCGRPHASRVGLSLLTQVGLGDLVTENMHDYVERAVSLAADHERRRRLRGELRDRMRSSPLMDAAGFTRKLETAFRDMWRRACSAEQCRAEAGSSANDSMSVLIKGGIRVRVPPRLDELTPYVLIEQEDWFEDEIDFVRRLAKPAMRCLDIGASYGVFSLTLAKQVGPDGHVWSFEPTGATVALLSQSVEENRLRNITLLQMALSGESGRQKLVIHPDPAYNHLADKVTDDSLFEIVEVKSLDDVVDEQTIESVDFIKMDAAGAEISVLQGGERFLQRESPLVMFELKYREGENWELVEALQARGYEIYRLVPGLQILVPLERGDIDPYLLNLFACKADRARLLESEGLAINRLPPRRAVDVGDPMAVLQTVLGERPYARALWPRWREALAGSAGDSSRDHLNGLALYCRSRDASLSVADRFQALCAAHAAMCDSRESSGEVARKLTLARISWELGYRQQALDVLASMRETTDAGHRTPGAPPFLAVSDRFDGIEPGDDLESWCAASVLHQIETLAAYSSYFRSEAALASLEALEQSSFQSPEMERRRQLVRMRLGLQEGPVPGPLVSRQSAVNLNAGFWNGNGEEPQSA